MTNEGATEELLGERTFPLIFLGIVTGVLMEENAFFLGGACSSV